MLVVKQKIKSLLKWLGCFELTCKVYDYFRFHASMLPTAPRNFFWFIHNYIIAYIPCHPLRILSCRYLLGIKLGKGCFVHLGVMFAGEIKMGDYVCVGRNSYFQGTIDIGNNVAIAAQASLIASSHDKDCKNFAGTDAPITIEDYVWLGARVMVLPGVRVGRGAILGAQSTATKDIPPYTVYAGSPAREVGKRSRDLEYRVFYRCLFH